MEAEPTEFESLVADAIDALPEQFQRVLESVAVVVSDAAGQAVVQLPGNFAAPQSGQVYQAWFVGPDGAAYRSHDAGATWEQVGSDLPRPRWTLLVP